MMLKFPEIILQVLSEQQLLRRCRVLCNPVATSIVGGDTQNNNDLVVELFIGMNTTSSF